MHSNRNYTEIECIMGKLEEMQWSGVRQEDDSEAEGKGLQNYGQTRGQDARLEINEMRMLRCMAGVTRRGRLSELRDYRNEIGMRDGSKEDSTTNRVAYRL